VARWAYYTEGGYDKMHFQFISTEPVGAESESSSREAFQRGVSATIDAYVSSGARLIVVGQVPQQRYDPMAVYYREARAAHDDAPARIRSLSVLRKDHEALQAFSSNIFTMEEKRGALRVLNLDDVYCDRDRCPMGTGSQSFYFDSDHLSLVGAALASPVLADWMGRETRSGTGTQRKID
jgi:hypothetical protein